MPRTWPYLVVIFVDSGPHTIDAIKSFNVFHHLFANIVLLVADNICDKLCDCFVMFAENVGDILFMGGCVYGGAGSRLILVLVVLEPKSVVGCACWLELCCCVCSLVWCISC